jgi:hypothetical protein
VTSPLLEYYGVVSFGRFSGWQEKPQSDVVKTAFGSHVNQYVLSIYIVFLSTQHVSDLVQDQLPKKGMYVAVE